jgi:hypothetical protein
VLPGGGDHSLDSPRLNEGVDALGGKVEPLPGLALGNHDGGPHGGVDEQVHAGLQIFLRSAPRRPVPGPLPPLAGGAAL